MGYKISILEGRKSVDVLSVKSDNHYNDSYIFGADQGLNVALATAGPIDKSYGNIKFIKVSWFLNEEDGSYRDEIIELESHACTSEELSSEFFPIHKSQERHLKVLQ